MRVLCLGHRSGCQSKRRATPHGWQVPDTQLRAPPGQERPHAPQLSGSLERLTQVSRQTSGMSTSHVHTPLRLNAFVTQVPSARVATPALAGDEPAALAPAEPMGPASDVAGGPGDLAAPDAS